MGSSTPGAAGENPIHNINGGGERTTAVGQYKIPANARKYQWGLDGSIRLWDKDGARINVDGTAMAKPGSSVDAKPVGAAGGTTTAAAPGASTGGDHTSGGDKASTAARAPTAEGDSCRVQASKLPFKLENGKLTLDPKNADVKKFMEANAKNAIPAALESMLPPEATTKARLEALRTNEELRNNVFALLKMINGFEEGGKPKEDAALYVEALNSLFGLPKGFLTVEDYPYGVDQSKWASLPAETQELFRAFRKQNIRDPNDQYQKYRMGLFAGHFEGSWQGFCLPCMFKVRPELAGGAPGGQSEADPQTAAR